MSKCCSYFLDPGENWDKKLDLFSSLGLSDIYFDYRYLQLYIDQDSNSVAEAFVFKEDNNIFFLPYLKKPIIEEDDLWDFETAYGYSGPLSSTEEQSFLESAWSSFLKMAKDKGLVAGLIRFNPLIANDKFSISKNCKVKKERDTVWLDCNRGLKNILDDYSKKHLKQIKSLESKGVFVESSNDKEFLKKFKEIYSYRMGAIGAGNEYFFNDEYFNKVFLMNKDSWKVYLAYTPNKDIIGGCLLLFSNNTCHYHLSGSYSEFLKFKPNDILRHNVIKDMVDLKIDKIHFGGGRTNDPEDSLLQFKLKFSKQTFKFKVGYCMVDEDNYLRVCDKWMGRFPEKKEYANYFLKYRY